MKDSFVINFKRFIKYSEEATGWFVKSLKFKPESEEQQICRLKGKISDREALKCLTEAEREL